MPQIFRGKAAKNKVGPMLKISVRVVARFPRNTTAHLLS